VHEVPAQVVVPTFAEPHAHLDRAFSTAITGWNRPVIACWADFGMLRG
jgi:cytosine/adenosine deaminase-related metal-dependent hydrolase